MSVLCSDLSDYVWSYLLNPVADIMGNYLAKLRCVRVSPDKTREEKLDDLLQHIVSSAPVNFTNEEIQDIQNAVYTMLERIMTRVNKRGIFNIARIVSSGSMAEGTAIWKVGYDLDKYLEFDFLARLTNSYKQFDDPSALSNCQGCISILNPPVILKRIRRWYNREDEFNAETLTNKDVISDLFLNEINYCLTLSCDCLSLQSNKDEHGYYNFSLEIRSASADHKHGCGECTVDMPSGTLRVNTEKTTDQYMDGPNNCSLIFQWNSKAKSMAAPDELLFETPQTINSLPIYVDFLPALECLKPASPGAGRNHDCFVVPKRCNVCDDQNFRWRKSWCMAEINAFTTKISDKHRKCYQIMKYLSERGLNYSANYHIKTVVLRHHTTCSDTTDNCVECVMRMFRFLLKAYKTNKLLSYQSNLNILNQSNHNVLKGQYKNLIASVEKDDCDRLILASHLGLFCSLS